MRKTRFTVSDAVKPGHACAAAMAGHVGGLLAGVVRRTSHPPWPWIKTMAVIPVSERGAADAARVQDCALDAAFLDRGARWVVAGALRGALQLAAETEWMQGMFVRIERSTT